MEAILLKTKLNTKDEADNGRVCFAFSGCWGAPGEGKLREGQDPNPRNSRNNASAFYSKNLSVMYQKLYNNLLLQKEVI